jgi:hypothetical protein
MTNRRKNTSAVHADDRSFEVESESAQLARPGLSFEAMNSFEVEDSAENEAQDASSTVHLQSIRKKDEKSGRKKKDTKKAKHSSSRKAKKDAGRAISSSDTSATDEFANPISDEWPTNEEGNLKLSRRHGLEMCAGVAELYTHLRQTASRDATVRDTYGLWMHLVDSDEENDDDASHIDQDDGAVAIDRHLLEQVRLTKNNKEALRMNNPKHMAEVELQTALKKRGLSTKGSQSEMANRLTKAFNDEAKKMSAVGPYTVHFISAATKRNLEMLVAKINSMRHGDLQIKLKTAHTDIEQNLMRLNRLYEVVNKKDAELLDRDALISSLKSKIESLEAKLASLGIVASTVAGGAGTGLLGHTMGAFAKESRGQALPAWTLAKIADTVAMTADCTILIIDKSTGFGWERAFLSRKIKTKDGRACRVYHTAWHLVNISSTSHFGGQAIADVLQSTGTTRVIPDVVVVMDPCKTVHGEDHSHQLQALLHAGIPCINSAESILQCAERPVVYAALRTIRNRLGADKTGNFSFPLIHQEFFANEAPGGIVPSFPVVTKLSSIHSGFGKIRCADDTVYSDVVGVVALSTDFYTTEELLENVVAEVHILQIGKVLRAYRKAKDVRFRTWSDWGDTQYEDIPLSSNYKAWASQIQPLFGGLDVFAIDVLQVEGGKEVILGIHTVGCGLADHHANEDATLIIEMILKKVDNRRKEIKSYATFS